MSHVAHRPNILVVLVDDLGYSDAQPYGGEARMPNLQKLADKGVLFRHSYTSSLCAPSRSMLLTGVDNHQNGLGIMPPFHSTNQIGHLGYEGFLNEQVVTLAECLRDDGYHTYMAGKWHLGFPKDKFPIKQGFERSFAYIGGGTSHWSDMTPLSQAESVTNFYVEDDAIVNQLPDDFYSSTYYADKLIQYLGEQTDTKPFFAYFALTAPHDPLHVPDEWIDNYQGQYDEGYAAVKAARVARMQALGLLDKNLPSTASETRFGNWNSLSDQEKRIEARTMEIYTAMIENIDVELGRVLKAIEDSEQLDNTVIFFLSDNGANPKKPWFYPPNTKEKIDQDFDNRFENMGKRGSFISIGEAWAEVANTPLSYFKLTSYEGGTKTPLIVSGAGIKSAGINHHDRLHISDIMPTILELTATQRPTTKDGQSLAPMYGKSYAKILTGEASEPFRGNEDTIGFEMLECKSLIKGDWKVLFEMPPYGDGKHWHLYNLVEDELEINDVSAKYPDKAKELIEEWENYASQVGYIQSNGDYQMLHYDSPSEIYKTLATVGAKLNS